MAERNDQSEFEIWVQSMGLDFMAAVYEDVRERAFKIWVNRGKPQSSSEDMLRDTKEAESQVMHELK